VGDWSRRAVLGAGGLAAAGVAFWSRGAAEPPEHFPLALSDADWRRRLSPAAFRVLRQDGTEAPFTSPLLNEHRSGLFACAGCNHPAFLSSTKFESGTGWPSFWAPVNQGVATRRDGSLGMERTEVHCPRCGGHLGHVFDDGPKPTGLRYCMNGVALRFQPKA
jgi:peptide-methionine (R)-S-oxide reductase